MPTGGPCNVTTAIRDVTRSGSRDGRQGTAVVGASLAGLMRGLALSRAGVGVTMLERSEAVPRAQRGRSRWGE
ncbi:FAD-dependent monooxygenase [Streptomyces mirabilis]|uniref:FAD-dependent monooxygenase n=1 Tax=Streptomyces mirabilis TaxID=68239 RepID=UPI003321C47B